MIYSWFLESLALPKLLFPPNGVPVELFRFCFHTYPCRTLFCSLYIPVLCTVLLSTDKTFVHRDPSKFSAYHLPWPWAGVRWIHWIHIFRTRRRSECFRLSENQPALVVTESLRQSNKYWEFFLFYLDKKIWNGSLQGKGLVDGRERDCWIRWEKIWRK